MEKVFGFFAVTGPTGGPTRPASGLLQSYFWAPRLRAQESKHACQQSETVEDFPPVSLFVCLFVDSCQTAIYERVCVGRGQSKLVHRWTRP